MDNKVEFLKSGLESGIDEISSKEKSFIFSLASDKLECQVIITGSSRGGTSLIAVIFRVAGIHLGERLGANHEDPRFHNSFYPEFNRNRFIRHISEQAHTLWGFKLPKAALFLEEIDREMKEYSPTYVFVFRSPLATALGEHYRGGNLSNNLHNSIIFYSKTAIFFKNHHDNRNFILCDYSEIARDPVPFLKAIANGFGIRLSQEQIEFVNAVNTRDGGGYVKF